MSENALHKRIIVDLGLIEDTQRALLAVKRGLQDNMTPLRPDRRTDLMAALELLQGNTDDLTL